MNASYVHDSWCPSHSLVHAGRMLGWGIHPSPAKLSPQHTQSSRPLSRFVWMSKAIISLLQIQCLFLTFLVFIEPAWGAPRNVTIPSNSSQILYTPFVCNASMTLDNPACEGAWNIIESGGRTLVYTNGPDSSAGDIIPQMFVRFRASFLFLETSAFSNATANMTVSAAGTTINLVFNSSSGGIAVIDLVESEITTATLTYTIPQNRTGRGPSRLDVGSLIITVDDETPASSYLPPVSSPPTASIPFTSTQSTRQPQTSSFPSSQPQPEIISEDQIPLNRRRLAEALGLTLGLGLGGTIVAVVGYIIWRKRRQKSVELEGVPPISRGARRWWWF